MTTLRRSVQHNPYNILTGVLTGFFIVLCWLCVPAPLAGLLTTIILFNTITVIFVSERYRQLHRRMRSLAIRQEMDSETIREVEKMDKRLLGIVA